MSGRAALRHPRLLRLVLTFLSVLAMTACATTRSYTAIREAGVLVEERWGDLSTFTTARDLDQILPRLDWDDVSSLWPPRGCVLTIRGARISWRPQEGRELQCREQPRDIDGHDVTRLGYLRASVGLGLSMIGTSRQTRHFVSIRFRDVSGAETTTRFHLEGRNADALLRSLSRVAGMAISTSAEEARRVPDGVAVTESADPLDLILPGVPRWNVRRLPVPADASDFLLSPDGLMAVADGALWEVSTGRRLGLLPAPRDPHLSAFSPDGRRLVLGHNDTRAKSEPNRPVGTVTVVDVSSPAIQSRVFSLPWVDRLAFSPDGRRAFVFHHAEPYSLRTGHAVTAVTLDQPAVAWRSPLGSGGMVRELTTVDVSPGAVMAAGVDWIHVLDPSTGETVFGPASVRDLVSANDSIIVGAQLVHTGIIDLVVSPGRGEKCDVAAVDIAGRPARTVTRSMTCAFNFVWTTLSQDQRVLLVLSIPSMIPSLMLLDARTLDVIGETTGQEGDQLALSGPDLWSALTSLLTFDVSGGRVVRDSGLPVGLGRHVVIWDIGTREHPLERPEPIGQCVYDGDAPRFVRGGAALVSAGDHQLIVCEERFPAPGTPVR